ncbi:rhodanese-like domain-containing protein [Aquimarina sp. AU474]|uniref:rhodanese-like domain-containing protein n=1 Tax=Aquimarina sp. AU474 TaxID=2108529 RepID=UPI000D68CF6A|nr:rhodanese-like domain-containing protein [Aquimarina sp. AU474]
MKQIITVLIYSMFSILAFGQDSLAELLDQYNNESIPYISVDELTGEQGEAILLDARELEEYNISHLKSAMHIGYTHFDIKKIINQPQIDKDTKIIVYCSLGIRSEDISEKLMQAGYTNVYNLYGGIFEWKNNDHPVINSKGEVTDNVHPCSKQWEKWLHKGKKIYK